MNDKILELCDGANRHHRESCTCEPIPKVRGVSSSDCTILMVGLVPFLPKERPEAIVVRLLVVPVPDQD